MHSVGRIVAPPIFTVYPIEIGAVGGLTQVTGESALGGWRGGGSGTVGVAIIYTGPTLVVVGIRTQHQSFSILSFAVLLVRDAQFLGCLFIVL